MHNFTHSITRPVLILVTLLFSIQQVRAGKPDKDIYQIKIFRLKSNEQMQMTDAYLKDAYLPALHKSGIKRVGVFKPITNDTAAIKSIFVFIPFSSEKEFFNLDEKLNKDKIYLEASRSFREAPSTNPPFDRMESILLEAFEGQKSFIAPVKKSGTIFEWRSYESPTENLHAKKVFMFEKEEIALFKKLEFNVVFYAKVLSGNRMPNFVYMPSFESVDERNAHWKTFGADPEWKAMQANPEYEGKVSVSRIDSYLMRAAEYSDL